MEKSHYHLCDHVYVAQYKNELILLDTKLDKYVICHEKISDLVLGLIVHGKTLSSFCHNENLEVINEIKKLIDNGILETKNIPYSFYTDCKPTSTGVSNVDWKLPLRSQRTSLNLSVLKAYKALIQINFYIKFKGFYSSLQLIKKHRDYRSNYVIPKHKELMGLANILNNACLLYPTRTKCLEWSMTFVLLALKRNWKCNIEIGVQNYPFLSHAWVECDGKIVMDSEGLRDGLAIVLSEPFRKLKK